MHGRATGTYVRLAIVHVGGTRVSKDPVCPVLPQERSQGVALAAFVQRVVSTDKYINSRRVKADLCLLTASFLSHELRDAQACCDVMQDIIT